MVGSPLSLSLSLFLSLSLTAASHYTPYETTPLTTLAEVATAPAPDLHLPDQTVVLSAATPSVQASSGVNGFVHFYGEVRTFLTTKVSIKATEDLLHCRNDLWSALVLEVANQQAQTPYHLVRNSQSAKSQNGASTLKP